MNLMYPIIERVLEDFLLFIGKAEFDPAKFLKQNDLIHPETDDENEKNLNFRFRVRVRLFKR